MAIDTQNSESLRILSQLFSPAFFGAIVRENNFGLFEKKVAKFIDLSTYNTNTEIIKDLYKHLQKQYRCEYIYKNSLFVHIIKKFGLKDTVTLNELKIGWSKADLVLLNGSIRVFEIKTELDDLSKLSKQLSDYQKFADKTYVVTDGKYAKKLTAEYNNTNVGLLVLNEKNKLETIKEAESNLLFFDFETIFKILRKQEYLDLVKDNFGLVPDVPNTKIFKVCYELLSKLELTSFQKQVLNKLKERKLQHPHLLKSAQTPKELKHICNSLDFSYIEYQNLYNFLATKTHVSTLYQRQTI